MKHALSPERKQVEYARNRNFVQMMATKTNPYLQLRVLGGDFLWIT